MNTTPTIAQFKAVLEYLPEPGVFIWIARRRGRAGGVFPGDVAGKLLKTGYVSVGAFNRDWLAHRLAVLFMTGAWPQGDVDHVDGSPANNEWSNLRVVTHRVNQQNRVRATAANKSGFLGVHFCKSSGRWLADIAVDGKNRRIGRFQTAEDAHAAYLNVKRLLHEGCSI
jgi:hypothetical protein